MRTLTAVWVGSMFVLAQQAHADPNAYVLLPNVVYGEKEIELLLGTADGPGPRDSAASLAFGISPTSYWATEIYANYARSGGTGTRFDGVEWENRFRLTEPGEYAIDWGAAIELEKPRNSDEGWYATFSGLMQGEIGNRVDWNFNPQLTVNWAGTAASTTILQYQAQLKYRYRSAFQFGVQGFGNLGKWDNWAPWDQQSHIFGPAVFGRTPLGGRQVLLYNAGWLFGINPGAAHNTLRAQIEYEF